MSATPFPAPVRGAVGVFTTDREIVVVSWDASLERMTGIAASTAIGRPLTAIVPDLESRGLLNVLREPLVSGAPQVLAPALHHFLIPAPAPAGASEFTEMQQRVLIGALRDERGPAGLVVTVEDVTRRLERERRLAQELRDTDPSKRKEAIGRLAELSPVDGLGPIRDLLGDDDWQVRREAVRVLSSRRDAALVDAVVAALRDGHRNFSLLSSALQLLAATGVDLTGAAIHLLDDASPDLRLQAALVLGTQRNPDAVAALLHALSDADTNVRFHAIEALGRLAPREAVEPLAAIATSGDFFLAFAALDALTRIDDPIVATRILPVLAEPMLAAPAAEALGQIGDEDAVAPLVRALDVSGAPVAAVVQAVLAIHQRYEREFRAGVHVRSLVRRSISDAGVASLLDRLTRFTGDELKTLVTVLGWLDGDAVREALAGALANPAVSPDVVEAFVRFGSLTADMLLGLIQRDEPEITRAAVVALGRLGDRRAVEPMVARLADADRDLQIATAGALARLGDSRAFEPLLALIGSPDAAVRQAVIGALNSIGHPQMAARVRELLEDADPRVRESAVRIAGYFGYTDCVPVVLARSVDMDESVRAAALEHLPYVDEARALPRLLDAVASDTPRARAAAAQALGAMDEPASRVALRRALEDVDAWVRYFAAGSLGRLRDEAALPLLGRAIISDPAHHVRVAAIEALGAIGCPDAIRVVEPVAAATSGDLAHAAMRVLGRIAPDPLREPIRSALRSDDAKTRRVAVDVLVDCRHAEAVALLRDVALGDGEPRVCAAALDGLVAIAGAACEASRAAIRAIIACVSDPVCRSAAVASLVNLAPSGVMALGEALHGSAAHTRRLVVDALGRVPHEAVSTYLRRALDDDDPGVRRQAIGAVARLGTRGVARRLQVLAESDPSPVVREAAAVAVTRYGGREGLPE